MLRVSLLLAALLAAPTSAQQGTGSAMSELPTLDGTYEGVIADTPAVLTLRQSEGTVQGTIDAAGYGYSLQGTVADGTASGTFSDSGTGATMPFELIEANDELTLTLQATDASGQTHPITFSFTRRGSVAPPPPAAPATPDPSVERDPVLIGAWSYSDTYNSGDFSGTTRLYLQINPDGSYLYGDGEVSIGGSGAYGSYSGQSGGGDVVQGHWRTEQQVLYVQPPGASSWMPHARYYVEGGRMLFTMGDGSRQVWHRR